MTYGMTEAGMRMAGAGWWLLACGAATAALHLAAWAADRLARRRGDAPLQNV